MSIDYRQYLGDCFEQAKAALKDNAIRTMMSVVGMAVGIAAVMLISVINQSGRAYVFSELETYGLNTLWIDRNWEKTNPFRAQRDGSGISNADLAALKMKCCPQVKRISPVVFPENWLINVRRGNHFSQASVEGVGVDYVAINNDELVMGRNFRPDEIRRRRPVAMIGPVTQLKLFGKRRSAIGNSIRIGATKLTVIGVLKSKDRSLLASVGAVDDYDVNARVLIPFTLYQQQMGTKDIQQIVAESADSASTDRAIDQVITILNRRNNERYDYQGDSMRVWIDNANTILGGIYAGGLIAASLSLMVGGIGILNIMSSSIIERTREIGLRKALGATSLDIRNQFLTEAIIISSLGGFLGCFIGIVGLVLLEAWSHYDLAIPWLSMSVAVIVSVIVGVVSGIIPAQRAAKLPPMIALRHE